MGAMKADPPLVRLDQDDVEHQLARRGRLVDQHLGDVDVARCAGVEWAATFAWASMISATA